ncbi:hypothetical protein SH580_09445 [Coraliomargarita algicola]|uniref:Outer membrane lipoprotein-sorting protein n=1 Tax=Coraliomargarita algicola TaxID=3092156 RepID=A0ABZ0RNW4_9BACT|nr:hypothetical protein [Coraliomargarita sp. J2-16]WPJ97934.1 hypothetical protein SH580_09445 [Coraliomargarita sp. J2-16]
MPLSAQRAGGDRDDRASRLMQRIDAEEGAQRLEAFRRQRLDGDFCFEFELEHKPRRARTVRYNGMMWGSWNELGPITRFRVEPASSKLDPQFDSVQAAVELIIQNGVAPQVWIRRSESESFQLVQGQALFEPILPGLLYSPFDLQMPFVYWEQFTYEGPTLVGATRVAQQFLMHPPEGSASAERGIAGVRVGLDDTYNALWRIEVMDTQGEVASRFAVESFQKVQEQYIVKRITLTEYPGKDRTTFDVESASVGISLEREIFSPVSMRPASDYKQWPMENL